MRKRTILCVLLPAAVLARAGEPGRTPDVVKLPEVIVSTLETAPGKTEVSREEMVAAVNVNVGEALTDVAGVSAIRRSASSTEPIIRGLTGQRVVTQIEGLPLYGACPSGMDPPVTFFAPSAVRGATVVKATPSVTLGPGGTGGRVLVKHDYDRGEEAAPEARGELSATWDEGRSGALGYVEGRGGSADMDARLEGHFSNLGDYQAADGTTVPAEEEAIGASVSLGWRPVAGQRLSGSLILQDFGHIDYPSLPMDTDDSQVGILTAGYSWQDDVSAWENVTVRAGYSSIDHRMSNSEKPNRKVLDASTDSEAQSLAVDALATLQANTRTRLTFGLNGLAVKQDALRTRTMLASGMTFRDPIWPDAWQNLGGLLGEASIDLNDQTAVRVGARVDYAEGDADAADAPLMPGVAVGRTTVRDQYVRLNGPAAAETSTEDTLGSGNIGMEWRPASAWMLYASAGLVSRVPSLTEKYFAFAPAPGGYLVGNPSLDPEKKYEIDLGVGYGRSKVKADVSVFASDVQDYIALTTLAREDVNGDGAPDRIRGYRNVDATLYGGEVVCLFDLGRGFSVPFTLAYVRGKNDTDDRNLPEIPPLNGRLDLRYQSESQNPWWMLFGLKYSAEQDKIDETFPETVTPSYEVFHLRGGVTFGERWVLEAGVENLFDELYTDHLTREAYLPVGDLKAGQRIPGPGRYVYITAKVLL